MQYRTLGNDLKVSAIGLGCMGFSHAYGVPIKKSEAISAIHKALDIGYTFFDTAECYIGTNPDGSISYNEELVSEALVHHRNEVQIATKFGVRHDGRNIITDSRPEIIRKSVENSLRKLKTDHIDLYYQHRIDEKIPAEEVAGVMSELIKEGKITHWGISEANEEYLRKADAVCHVTAIQNRYSMMYREYECLFPVLEELGIGFVAFSPMANGVLSGKYSSNNKFSHDDYRSIMPQFTTEAVKENQELFSRLEQFAKSKGATLSQLSMAWMLCKKPWIVPIPGTRKIERMKENFQASNILLTKDEVIALDKILNNTKMSNVFGGSKIVK